MIKKIVAHFPISTSQNYHFKGVMSGFTSLIMNTDQRCLFWPNYPACNFCNDWSRKLSHKKCRWTKEEGEEPTKTFFNIRFFLNQIEDGISLRLRVNSAKYVAR